MAFCFSSYFLSFHTTQSTTTTTIQTNNKKIHHIEDWAKFMKMMLMMTMKWPPKRSTHTHINISCLLVGWYIVVIEQDQNFVEKKYRERNEIYKRAHIDTLKPIVQKKRFAQKDHIRGHTQ